MSRLHAHTYRPTDGDRNTRTSRTCSENTIRISIYKYSTLLVLLLIISFKYLLCKFKLKKNTSLWLMSSTPADRFERDAQKCIHAGWKYHSLECDSSSPTREMKMWKTLRRFVERKCALSLGIRVVLQPKRWNTVDQVKREKNRSTFK